MAEIFKEKAWKAYLGHLDNKHNYPDNGWFEAREAIDLIIRTEDPDLKEILTLLRTAIKKNRAVWTQFYHVVFTEMAKPGDKVRFIKPHAATSKTEGTIESFKSTVSDTVMVIRISSKACVNSHSSNLKLI